MKRILSFLKHEFRKMLPPTIYFFVVLHIILFARNLLAEEWGFKIASSALATIGALIIGKAILIADALPLFQKLAGKRLIYDVAARTILYALIALFLQFLEEFIPLLLKHEGVGEAINQMMSEVDWSQFWVSHLFMVMFLLFYTTITGLMRLAEHKSVLHALLHPVPGKTQHPSESVSGS